jgi:hypothetical protein
MKPDKPREQFPVPGSIVTQTHDLSNSYISLARSIFAVYIESPPEAIRRMNFWIREPDHNEGKLAVKNIVSRTPLVDRKI